MVKSFWSLLPVGFHAAMSSGGMHFNTRFRPFVAILRTSSIDATRRLPLTKIGRRSLSLSPSPAG